MKAYGKLDWAFAAGRIPFHSTGKEPELGSHDKIAILNTSGEAVEVKLTLVYEDAPPVTYKIELKPRRLQKVRFNDLIDPVAIELDKNYACYIRSEYPVVVQFSRQNTGAKANAEMGSMAFPVTN